MKLNRPWTGPWIVIKRLSEVVYRIKYFGPTGSYSRVKRRVVHFNQLKPFVGARVKAGLPLRQDLPRPCVLLQLKRAVMQG